MLLILLACRPEGPVDTGSTSAPETGDPADRPSAATGDSRLIPSDLDGPCQADRDCVEGLVCVLESPGTPDQVDTCQLPCTGEWLECPGYWTCHRSAVPPWCIRGDGTD